MPFSSAKRSCVPRIPEPRSRAYSTSCPCCTAANLVGNLQRREPFRAERRAGFLVAEYAFRHTAMDFSSEGLTGGRPSAPPSGLNQRGVSMQKKLLTMAVAGALAGPGLALAQSSVEVYGTVYPTFGLAKYSDGFTARSFRAPATPGGAPVVPTGLQSIPVPSMSKVDVQAPSSNFGVRGREGLGGGLTAWFQIEQNAPLEREATQAVTVASRNSAAGIQGGFGNVFVGQWTTPWADMESLWAVGQVSVFGPVTSLIGRRESTGVAPNPASARGQACTTTVIAPGGTAGPSTNTVAQCDAVVA